MSEDCTCCTYESKEEPCCCGVLSHSNLFGPSLDEVLIHFLLLLFPTLEKKLSGAPHPPYYPKTSRSQQGEKLNLESWLSQETTALACEMSNLGMDSREPPENSSPTASMLTARRFVLRRLAELMAKKEELEMTRKQ